MSVYVSVCNAYCARECALQKWLDRSRCCMGHLGPRLVWAPHTHTHTHLPALFPGLPGWAGTRKVKPIWILLKQDTVSGSDISWAICKYAPRSRQITTPATRCSVFYRPDALSAAQPTASKHWRDVGPKELCIRRGACWCYPVNTIERRMCWTVHIMSENWPLVWTCYVFSVSKVITDE